MLDMEEMMNKVNNIDEKVDKLYSKEFQNYGETLIAQNNNTERLYKEMEHKFIETNEHLEAALKVIESKDETLDLALKNVYNLSKDNEKLQKTVNDLTEEKKAFEKSREEWKNTAMNMAKERDTIAASLAAETERVKACNKDYYEYRLSSNGTIKGYQQELEKARSERDTAKALKEQLEEDFGILAENHKNLCDQYSELKEKNERLNVDVHYFKSRYGAKIIEFNKLNGEYHDLENEHYALTEVAYKYSWKRVDCLTASILEDHQLYLFAVDGYPTPVKGKFHDDSLSNITIIVDDGKGKGPERKTLFFIDGHIRYWTQLPEMPDMPKGVDLDD